MAEIRTFRAVAHQHEFSGIQNCDRAVFINVAFRADFRALSQTAFDDAEIVKVNAAVAIEVSFSVVRFRFIVKDCAIHSYGKNVITGTPPYAL